MHLLLCIMISSACSLMGMKHTTYPIKFKESYACVLTPEIHSSLLALTRSTEIRALPPELAVLIAAYVIAPDKRNNFSELESFNLVYEFLHHMPPERREAYEKILLPTVDPVKKILYMCATRNKDLLDAPNLPRITDNASRDTCWMSPLHVSARYNNILLTKRLIEEHKAHVDDQNAKDKVTPLMMACAYGSPEMVAYLLNNNASTSAEDLNGDIALYYTAHNKTHGIELLELILNKMNRFTKLFSAPFEKVLFETFKSGNYTFFEALIKRHPGKCLSFFYSLFIVYLPSQPNMIEYLITSDTPMIMKLIIDLIESDLTDNKHHKTLKNNIPEILFTIFKAASQKAKYQITEWCLNTYGEQIITYMNNHHIKIEPDTIDPLCLPYFLHWGLVSKKYVLAYITNLFVKNDFNEKMTPLFDRLGDDFFNHNHISSLVYQYHKKNGSYVAIESFWHLYRYLPKKLHNPLYFLAIPELFERCIMAIPKEDRAVVINQALKACASVQHPLIIHSLKNPAYTQAINLFDYITHHDFEIDSNISNDN